MTWHHSPSGEWVPSEPAEGEPRLSPAELDALAAEDAAEQAGPPSAEPEVCPECDGFRVVPDSPEDGQLCPTCRGAGVFYEEGDEP